MKEPNGDPLLVKPIPQISLKRRGLLNLGNTCFLNSLLQALVSDKEFVNAILNSSHIHCEKMPCILAEIKEVFLELRKCTSIPFAPRQFHKCMAAYLTHYNMGEQFDVHECYIQLVKVLEECERGIVDCFWGETASMRKCVSCDYETFRKEIFECTVLYVSESVQVSIDKIHEGDRMTDFTCPKCHAHVISSATFITIPRIMVFLVHRLSAVKVDDDTIIEKDRNPLDCTFRITLKDEKSIEFSYELFAYTIHNGSRPNEGHYTCAVKNHDQLFLWDDSEVYLTNDISTCQNAGEPYLLFYRKEDVEERMDIQVPTSNERSRTYWTPTMERYFVDLLLEKMHRGNRVGHNFNKQAWTDMLALFKGQFGSQYDKDVLKSHYTNLRKQFNDVKYLLRQSGFSWDETEQMVIADDYVWNACIRVHPDLLSYKTEVVLNFNNLGLIFEDTSADGRCSRSNDDEARAVNIGDGIGSLGASSNERSRTVWTPAMDQYFIELLLDQVASRNKTDNTFNEKAWEYMLSLFNAKFGPQHDKWVLRHRYRKMSKYCSDVGILLKQDGFSWDGAQQIIAADDTVWDSYIKAHPHAQTYRSKTHPAYNDLVLIFGNAVDEGTRTYLPQDKDLEDDISGIKAGEGKGRQTLTRSMSERTFWTEPMDQYLVDLLRGPLGGGNRPGKKCRSWVNMIKPFNTKFKSNYDKYVLKNRFKNLSKLYKNIKAHPDAQSYTVKTVPSYHELCAVLGEESSDGGYNHLSRNADPIGEIPVSMIGEEINDHSPDSIDQSRIDWTSSMDLLEQVNGGNKIDKGHPDAISYRDKVLASYSDLCNSCGKEKLDERLDGQNMVMEIPGGDIQLSDQRRKRPAVVPPNLGCSSKAMKMGHEMQKALSGMTGVVRSLASKKEKKKYTKVELAVHAVQEIPDMGDETVLDACDFLEDQAKADIFLALDVKLRKKWILRKLGRQ